VAPEALPHLTDGDLTVRPAAPSDLEGMRRLFEDPSVERWWGAHDDERLRHRLDRDDVLGFLVEQDGRVVGWIQVSEENSPAYRHAGIDIATAAEVHGTGVGVRALGLVRDWLVGPRGHHRLTIDPAASNERAIAAYRKAGFTDVGVMRAYERTADGSFHDALLMEYVVGVPDAG